MARLTVEEMNAVMCERALTTPLVGPTDDEGLMLQALQSRIRAEVWAEAAECLQRQCYCDPQLRGIFGHKISCGHEYAAEFRARAEQEVPRGEA